MRPLVTSSAMLVLLVGPVVGQERPASDSAAAVLIGELGCAVCHVELAAKTTLRERAPDLSSAGRRYNPAYLFAYLQKPETVRRHLGRARMPDFHLSADEALALARYLATQKQTTGDWPELPKAIRDRSAGAAGTLSTAEFRKLASGELLCMTCHSLDTKGGPIAAEFAAMGYRLQRDWVREFLAAPGMFGVDAMAMPPRFYEPTEDRKAFRELVAEPAAKIERLTAYLFSRNETRREALQASFTAAMGERIFRALNCAACHRHPTIRPREADAAPDLTREGQRVTAEWLKKYLARPHAIRPFGNRPGDGGRMPDFRLTSAEVDTISAYLAKTSASAKPPSFTPERLTAFSMRKAKSLLHDKLPCLGCHQLGDKGGRIGPDLTGVSARLRPEFLYRMITRPRSVVPHTVMPRFPMPDRTARLITNYLWQSGQQPGTQPTQSKTGYLSLVDNPSLPLPKARSASVDGKHLYLTRCAACHGATGRGDGFNASFLPVKPTVHADAVYMATRPDDTLFDGIHAGGYILNKSHLMPAWGLSLSTGEIRGLVKHMRTLCNCQGPAWSRR